MKTRKYIVVKDNKILHNFHTTQGLEGVKKSISGIDYDNIIEIPIESNVLKSTDIREYDNKWNIRPISDRVTDGFVVLPRGYKLLGDSIIPMTIEELVKGKEIELPPRFKAIGNEIIQMTDEEIISSRQATRKQLDDEKMERNNEDLIQAKIRELAISELKKEGKIK